MSSNPLPDLTPLLDPDTPVEEVEILGIRLGDDAEKLRNLTIESGMPTGTEDMQLAYENGGSWKVLPDGTRQRLSLAEIVDMSIANGGSLHCCGAGYNVQDSRVVGIHVTEEAVQVLGVESFERIRELFGTPDQSDTGSDSSTYYYLERKVTLHFDQRRNRLKWLHLGNDRSPLAHSRGNFLFGGGLSCQLRKIVQSLTYEGLLEGLPTEEMNQRTKLSVVERAKKEFGPHIHLVEPAETPIEYRRAEPYRFGTPSKMPGICCKASFKCSFTQNASKDWSTLTVVWFQDQFAFPIADEIVEAFTHIDWRNLAEEYEY